MTIEQTMFRAHLVVSVLGCVLGAGDGARAGNARAWSARLGLTRSWVRSSRSTCGFVTIGRELALAELFGRRPVILAPVYYRCPLLCNQLLSGLTRSLKPVSLGRRQGFRRGRLQHQPRRDARAGGPEEGGLSRAVRPAGLGSRVALPDGRRGVDRGPGQGDRVSLHVQPGDQALRPRRRAW